MTDDDKAWVSRQIIRAALERRIDECHAEIEALKAELVMLQDALEKLGPVK